MPAVNFKKYPEIILQTAVYPTKVDDFSIAYFTIGFFDEIIEYFEKVEEKAEKKELIKEAGDVCWYACGLCTKLNIDFIDLLENPIKDNTAAPFKLLGLVKKYYRDNKALDVETVKAMLSNILVTITSDFDINDVLETNYNKLLTRLANDTIKGDGDNR